MHKHNVGISSQPLSQACEGIFNRTIERTNQIIAVDVGDREGKVIVRINGQLTRGRSVVCRCHDIHVTTDGIPKPLNRRSLRVFLTLKATKVHRCVKTDRGVKHLVIRKLQSKFQPATDIGLHAS